MALTDIEELLAERLGFDVETIGSKAVAAMVTRAMEQAGFSDPASYARALRNDPEAWERFVDRVVVPETWFFRDVTPFELAADLIRARLRLDSGRVTRILSCPCASGEESYSVVMSMLDAGAPPDSFCVDAVDVSRGLLEAARAAVFNARSFRGEFPSDRESYFESRESDGSWRLNAAARDFVRFRQGNIVAPGFLADEPPYDLVFCRNLLIYLHAEARVVAMTALRRLVANDGVLVLGHAEAAFARENGFRPTGPSGAFAFVKSGDTFTRAREPVESRRVLTSVRTPVARSPIAPMIAPSPPPQAILDDGIRPKESVHLLLAKAIQLGDAGELHLALRICGEYLQQVPNSPEGYFLLGLLQDALGHIDLAAGSFRKVLYLDPNHHEALLCLALKREASGDASGAALLRERARRAQAEDKTSNV